MAEIEKKFLSGRMNKDVDKRLIADGEYLDAINITINTSEGSTIGAAQNPYGNDKIANINDVLAARGLNSISNPIVIGALPYEAQNLIYWFVTSDNFDGIFEYNELTGDTVLVLGSTTGQLNFNGRYIITGVNYVYNSAGSLLFWTDGYNPPRRINISRCKTYNIDDAKINDDINVVLRPPLSAPYIRLSNTNTADLRPNNIEQKFLYFSYRFKYVDNEYSSMSPFSAVAFHPKAFSIDVETGENKGMVNIYNQVNLEIETGNQFVKEIQLLVRDTSGLNVRIVDSFNKDELSIPNDSSYRFTFMNNKTYAALPADQTTRLFDNVPLLASAQEIIGNRLIYGDYTQFRDIVSCDNQFINVNYKVGYVSTLVTSGIPVQTFRSDRDYEIGIAYSDDYGRMTTVLTSNNTNNTNDKSNAVYIPPIASSTANSLLMTISSPAPCWATNYKIFVKQSKGDYYNIFPRTFLKSGNYRYFLINEADRDKIIVNEYIIFKTFDNGPTHSNKQFKVLELEYKPVGFITNALEGLYFKIKAGPGDTFLYTPVQQSYSNNQSGRGPRPAGVCGDIGTQNVVEYRHLFAEGPIYYSGLNDNTIQNTGPTITANNSLSIASSDNRISIEILPGGSSFRWTWEVGQAWYLADLQISANPMTLVVNNNNKLSVSFSATSGYNPGDKFIFNLRGTGAYAGTPLQPTNGTRGLPPGGDPLTADYYLTGNPDKYGGHVILKGPGEIFPGAVISINILNDGPSNNAPGQNASSMSWTSTQYYKDIEEWFWQSGAYLTFTQYDQSGNNILASAVTFRYGTLSTQAGLGITYPSNSITQTNSGDKYMLIRGFGKNYGCTRNLIQAELKVTQTPSNKQLIAETVPKESDLDIFHELSHTYPVDQGKHLVLWRYDKSNLDVLGTKLTRTLDHKYPHYFTAGDMVYVRASNITPGFYQVMSTPDRYTVVINLAYPGTIQPGTIAFNNTDQDQGVGINPAQLSINNYKFKNSDYNAFAYGNGLESYRILDDYNAPRMDYSLRASTIIEDYEEQQKYASLTYSGLYRGDSSINRLNEFNLSLANFKNLDKSFGPVRKLFARDTDLLVLHQDKVTSVYYGKNLLVDAVGGSQVASVPEVLGTQIASQSEYGISDNPESFAVWSNNYYFSDARRGVVLMMTGNDIVEISENGLRDYFIDFFSLAPNTQKLGGYDPHNQTYMISGNNIERNPCRTSITPGIRTISGFTNGQSYFMFSVNSVTTWEIQLENIGFGTNWVDVPPYCLSGTNSQDIYANVQNNFTGSPRSVRFVLRYCDNVLEFTLTQGVGRKTDIGLIAFNKPK